MENPEGTRIALGLIILQISSDQRFPSGRVQRFPQCRSQIHFVSLHCVIWFSVNRSSCTSGVSILRNSKRFVP